MFVRQKIVEIVGKVYVGLDENEIFCGLFRIVHGMKTMVVTIKTLEMEEIL